MKKRMLALLMVLCMVGSLTSAVDDGIMRADAAEKTLNIVTTFGTSEVGQYGVPNAFMGRYDAITAKVADIYADRFGITINFSKPATNYVVSSPADQCKTGASTFDALCSHAANSACNVNGPFHHTNCGYMTYHLYPNSRQRPYGLEMHITAVKMCAAEAGQHFLVDGVTAPDYGTLIVRDNDYANVGGVSNWLGDTEHTQYVVQTMIHEIGHLYGVQDHYNNSLGAKDNCIWGFNKDSALVISKISMCSDCRSVIETNVRKYNF